MTHTLRWLTLTGLLVTPAGCTAQASPPALFLGHVGTTDRAGTHEQQGIRLALEELKNNAVSQSLGGRPLHVRHTDTRGDVTAYRAEAVRLVSVSRCLALLGGHTPDEVAAMAKAGVPVLSFAGRSAPDAGDSVLSLGMTPARQGQVLAAFVGGSADRVTLVLDPDYEPAGAVAEAFQAALAKDGKARATSFTLGDKSDAPETGALVFVGEAKRFNEFIATVPGGAMLVYAGPEVDPRDLDVSRGPGPVYLATAFAADKETPTTQTFATRYGEAFKQPPDANAALAYEGTLLLAAALKQTFPSATPEKLRDALRGLKDVQGVAGPLTVTPEQHVRRALFVVRAEASGVSVVRRWGPAD